MISFKRFESEPVVKRVFIYDLLCHRRGLFLEIGCSMTLPCKRCPVMQYRKYRTMRGLEVG